jgi:predicted DNA-binding ribbon-helix-helix protein
MDRPGRLGAPTDSLSRRVSFGGRRTSLTLERHAWEASDEICAREGIGLAGILAQLEARRGMRPLGAAMRIFILEYFRQAAPAATGFAYSPPEEGASPLGTTPTDLERLRSGLVGGALDKVGPAPGAVPDR